jgi:hypothetical protein
MIEIMDSLSCFLHNVNSTSRIQDATGKCTFKNIRLELQMGFEQRHVVSSPHLKEMKLPAIVAELAAVYYKDAFNKNKVKYWPHEIMLHRSDLSDPPSSGRSPLEDIDARILKVLEAEPRSSVRTIAELLKIPASTVHL